MIKSENIYLSLCYTLYSISKYQVIQYILNLTTFHILIKEKKTMKAIISNGKRTEVFSNHLEFEGLNKFLSEKFPGMKNPLISYKNTQGNNLNISSNEDIQNLMKDYQGQNFVQISIRRPEKKEKENINFEKGDKCNKREKRIFILSKIYGGQPKDFELFLTENPGLTVGKLIKVYAQKNKIQNPLKESSDQKSSSKDKRPCFERRKKILLKVLGVKQEDYQKFQQENKDLKFGQIIKKFKTQNAQWRKQSLEKRKQRRLEKLSKFLSKPQEEFINLVEQNPESNFKDLLNILESQGVLVDKSKIEGFKKQFKQQKQLEKAKNKEEKQLKKQTEKEEHKKEHKQKKSKSKNKKEQKRSKSKQNSKNKKKHSKERNGKNQSQDEISKRKNDVRKGKILVTMKQLFGVENMKEYLKFINENIHLGEDGIINKWLER